MHIPSQAPKRGSPIRFVSRDSPYPGYDGGDCCECTCDSTLPFSCGDDAEFDCVDPSASCFNFYVEAGTKTTVGVSTNGYDTRPGQASGDSGCLVDGCAPELARDGISADVESRWSCSQSIIPSGRLCRIDFSFEEPQDIVFVEVDFWKLEERTRTLEVSASLSFPETRVTIRVTGASVTGATHYLHYHGLADLGQWLCITQACTSK